MARDDTWFERLYERHHRAVSAYCVRRIGESDAPDAVAQVFSVAWRRRADLPDEDRVLPWLYGVARRVLSHHWRGTNRARRLLEKAGAQPVAASPGPDAIVEVSIEHQRVRDTVMELGAMDREVLLLSAWEGLSHPEIAEAIGCSRAAVDKRMGRAKARLAKRYLASDDEAGTAEDLQFSQRASTKEVRTRENR